MACCASVPTSGTEALFFAVPIGSADGCCQTLTTQNNPLMIRAQHWKFPIVLPTFWLSVIGA